jgi:hypothetical protein
MDNIFLGIIALAVLAGIVGVVRTILPGRKTREEALRRDLERMLFGDIQAAERLIALERKRAPHKPKLELIKAAITRLQNDLR